MGNLGLYSLVLCTQDAQIRWVVISQHGEIIRTVKWPHRRPDLFIYIIVFPLPEI